MHELEQSVCSTWSVAERGSGCKKGLFVRLGAIIATEALSAAS